MFPMLTQAFWPKTKLLVGGSNFGYFMKKKYLVTFLPIFCPSSENLFPSARILFPLMRQEIKLGELATAS